MAETLKKGWTQVAFGDVVRLCKERSSDPEADGFDRYVGLEHLDPDDLKLRRWGQVAEGTTFTSVFRAGQVLFGKRRAYQRKVSVADFDGVCSGDIYVFEPKDEHLLPELLPFICQTDGFFEHAVGTSAGSLSPRTNWNSLASYEFALPPLKEQQRIAEILTSASKVCESILLLLKRLEILEQAFLCDTFGYKPGESPSGLDIIPLSALAEIRTGLAKGRLPDSSTTTRHYLSVANVKDGCLDLSEMKEIVVEVDKIERYSLRHGDVLMTEGGDLDKLGRGTVWQNEVKGCLHQNHVFAVRTDRHRLNPWYLAALARSRYGRAYFLACAKRTSNLASVNKRQLGELPVPLMKLPEQERWVDFYCSLRAGQEALNQRLSLAMGMRDKLLNRLVGQ